jgi:hypothetical protein
LVRGKFELAAEPNPSGLRALSAFVSARQDQVTLELCEATEDGEH